MYERMENGMDLNCGTILDGLESAHEMGTRIFEAFVEVAPGKLTKSESLSPDDEEFEPWMIGAQM